jgi:hypothetical protein
MVTTSDKAHATVPPARKAARIPVAGRRGNGHVAEGFAPPRRTTLTKRCAALECGLEVTMRRGSPLAHRGARMPEPASDSPHLAQGPPARLSDPLPSRYHSGVICRRASCERIRRPNLTTRTRLRRSPCAYQSSCTKPSSGAQLEKIAPSPRPSALRFATTSRRTPLPEPRSQAAPLEHGGTARTSPRTRNDPHPSATNRGADRSRRTG